jgi:hypothetical protein
MVLVGEVDQGSVVGPGTVVVPDGGSMTWTLVGVGPVTSAAGVLAPGSAQPVPVRGLPWAAASWAEGGGQP